MVLAVAVLAATLAYVGVMIERALKGVIDAVNGVWQSTSQQPTYVSMDEVMAQHALLAPPVDMVLESELLAEEMEPLDF